MADENRYYYNLANEAEDIDTVLQNLIGLLVASNSGKIVKVINSSGEYVYGAEDLPNEIVINTSVDYGSYTPGGSIPEGNSDCLYIGQENKIYYWTGSNYQVIAGVNGRDGHDGQDGQDGVGITSITKTDTAGLVDTYTISYTNGNSTTFTVTNGADGQDGAPGQDGAQGQDGVPGQDGQDGQDGFSPVVTTQAITGGTQVTITDATGNHVFNVMNGTSGSITVDAEEHQVIVGDGNNGAIGGESSNYKVFFENNRFGPDVAGGAFTISSNPKIRLKEKVNVDDPDEEVDHFTLYLGGTNLTALDGTTRFTMHDNAKMDLTGGYDRPDAGPQIYFHGNSLINVDDEVYPAITSEDQRQYAPFYGFSGNIIFNRDTSYTGSLTQQEIYNLIIAVQDLNTILASALQSHPSKYVYYDTVNEVAILSDTIIYDSNKVLLGKLNIIWTFCANIYYDGTTRQQATMFQKEVNHETILSSSFTSYFTGNTPTIVYSYVIKSDTSFSLALVSQKYDLQLNKSYRPFYYMVNQKLDSISPGGAFFTITGDPSVNLQHWARFDMRDNSMFEGYGTGFLKFSDECFYLYGREKQYGDGISINITNSEEYYRCRSDRSEDLLRKSPEISIYGPSKIHLTEAPLIEMKGTPIIRIKEEATLWMNGRSTIYMDGRTMFRMQNDNLNGDERGPLFDFSQNQILMCGDGALYTPATPELIASDLSLRFDSTKYEGNYSIPCVNIADQTLITFNGNDNVNIVAMSGGYIYRDTKAFSHNSGYSHTEIHDNSMLFMSKTKSIWEYPDDIDKNHLQKDWRPNLIDRTDAAVVEVLDSSQFRMKGTFTDTATIKDTIIIAAYYDTEAQAQELDITTERFKENLEETIFDIGDNIDRIDAAVFKYSGHLASLDYSDNDKSISIYSISYKHYSYDSDIGKWCVTVWITGKVSGIQQNFDASTKEFNDSYIYASTIVYNSWSDIPAATQEEIKQKMYEQNKKLINIEDIQITNFTHTTEQSYPPQVYDIKYGTTVKDFVNDHVDKQNGSPLFEMLGDTEFRLNENGITLTDDTDTLTMTIADLKAALAGGGGGGGGGGYIQEAIWSSATSTDPAGQFTLSKSINNFDEIVFSGAWSIDGTTYRKSNSILSVDLAKIVGQNAAVEVLENDVYYMYCRMDTDTHLIYVDGRVMGMDTIYGIKYSSGGGGESLSGTS